MYLTTGRVVSQYLSGTQTRRIGPLVDQHPEPKLEIHPRLADELGIATGDWVTVTTRRMEMTLQALVVQDDPARHRVHPVPLGGRAERATSSRIARSTRAARSRSTRCRRAAWRRRGPPPGWPPPPDKSKGKLLHIVEQDMSKG